MLRQVNQWQIQFEDYEDEDSSVTFLSDGKRIVSGSREQYSLCVGC
jgi:hypothetical protein